MVLGWPCQEPMEPGGLVVLVVGDIAAAPTSGEQVVVARLAADRWVAVACWVVGQVSEVRSTVPPHHC